MISGKYTIDRFEGELAILLNRANESLEVIKSKGELPKGVKEGDILHLEFHSAKLISSKILKEETEQAKMAVKDLLNKLKNK